MEYYVKEDSIVRKIWGKGDTILFIFAGSAAEFALNKAVDWLYFTGKLPADPMGRLFSTVTYARKIVFSENEEALKAIDKITAIHKTVEENRGARIPDWAYRDVLFMLIDYSIRSYEILERDLTVSEKEDVFQVFYRMGKQMNLVGLPSDLQEWLIMRQHHLEQNLHYGELTKDLFLQYKIHLGPVRYRLLRQGQKLVVPDRVNTLLSNGNTQWLKPVIFVYKLSRKIHLNNFLRNIILPDKYKNEIRELDR
ncbi:MAG: oxygenase MpaB family protein [Ferruginibacter sp.]